MIKNIQNVCIYTEIILFHVRWYKYENVLMSYVFKINICRINLFRKNGRKKLINLSIMGSLHGG